MRISNPPYCAATQIRVGTIAGCWRPRLPVTQKSVNKTVYQFIKIFQNVLMEFYDRLPLRGAIGVGGGDLLGADGGVVVADEMWQAVLSETPTSIDKPPNMGPHTIDFVGVDLCIPLLADPLPLFVADSPMVPTEFACQDLICAGPISVNGRPTVHKGTSKWANFCSRRRAFLAQFPIVESGHDLQNEAATKLLLHCPHNMS